MEGFKKKWNTYHEGSLSKHSFLITGGAGFIGSNIVSYLIENNAGKIRVLDNLSNGDLRNIKNYLDYPGFEFINGDITDYKTCCEAIEGMEYISHQAALGSVPRSIKDPISSNHANVTGFLNILDASKNSKTLKKLVYAASSSTYGDSKTLPKIEGEEGKPVSPYAATKLINEIYAEIYSRVYNFHTIGLRYFNIYGPNQSPNNPYAAVIPIFCDCFLNNRKPLINGDGQTSRDFTYVSNAIQANIKALLNTQLSKHEVYNVACGEKTSLNEIIKLLSDFTGKKIEVIYGPERKGDVRHSKADISKITTDLNFHPDVKFKDGIKLVYNWYLNSDEDE